MHANKTHQECRMGSTCQINKWHKLKWCHSKETDFKWSSSCWETNVHWTFWFLDGPNWTKKDLCHVKNCTFCRVLTFWASSTEWHLQRTYALLTFFNNHHHTAAWVANTSRGKGNNSIWHGKLVRSLRIYVGPLTIRVTDHMVIDIEDDQDGEFIKEEFKQRHSANNYTSMSHFWI